MKEIKNLKYLYCSIFVLAVLIIFFVKAFVSNELIYFLISAALIIIFILLYSITNKKITCEDKYTVVQAFFFYEKCKKAGVENFSGELSDAQKKSLDAVFAEHQYAKDFDNEKLQKLFDVGLAVREHFNGNNKKEGKK